MRVKIKQFNVEMEIQNRGIELEIRTPDGKSQLGDLKINRSGLEWRKGRAHTGPSKTWKQFIEYMEK